MLFNSYAFIFAFFPVAVIGYFLLGKYQGGRLSNAWLVMASLFFYGYWNVRYLPLLVGSIAVNYLIAGEIVKAQSISGEKRGGRAFFAFGLIFNLGLLCFYKYTDFIIKNIDRLFQLDIPLTGITLPFGISFFSITQIVFLVGAYFYGEGKKERSFINYALFVSFFPHLIAGPILYHKQMMKQFRNEKLRHPNVENIARGIALFVIGLFKKVVIADKFIAPVAAGFDNAAGLAMLDGWTVAICYALELYYDFSGYSDMAVGMSKIMNIDIPINFSAPFRADSLIEFWNRWHISLTTTITAYIYTPLVRMKKEASFAWTMFATVITMFIIGVWHGAGWTYALNGVLQGVGLCVNHIWRRMGLKMPGALAHIMTVIFAVVSVVLFRAASVHQAMDLYRAMLGRHGGIHLPVEWMPDHLTVFLTHSPFQYMPSPWVVIVAVLLIAFCPDSNTLVKKYFRADIKWAVALAAMFVFSVLHFSQVTVFLYSQF
ncbi:MAG: MBOAT family protein [Schwartzia sp.]|nr:MBOAT family protein [Schwartzia sp. (in: firmicutes)]